ncbi:MAG: polyketide cyclase [Methanobacteriales archaeon HGW-Methanobacteriales-1]|jgi:uncharacterized protein YndB with AHSA1/START domain|nr:MAG: polyketide cyclase [Methanobacteriales archaeon HGW-Methanobacteriales-1]
MIKINEKAPVTARAKIEINADPELVWKIMVNIEEWPRWNPEIKSAAIFGDLSVGTKFKWKAGPGTITSQILEVDPPKTLAWKGKTMGIKAIHLWNIDFINEKTVVSTEESWDGIIVHLMKGTMQKSLQKSINAGLKYLKIESEKNR